MKKKQKPSPAKSEEDMSPLERKISELEEAHYGKSVSLDWLRQRNRRAAYHEAAHVTAKMFTGQWEGIERVSIIPCSINTGRVSYRPEAIDLLFNATGLPRSWRESAGKTLLLFLFAGPKAEYHVEAFPDSVFKQTASKPRWLDDGFLDEDETWNLEGSDFFEAKRIAESLARPGYPAYRVLELGARWTEEMLALPEMWAATEVLATLLLERGELDDLEEIHGVCDEIRDMWRRLSKWRRRLSVKVSDQG